MLALQNRRNRTTIRQVNEKTGGEMGVDAYQTNRTTFSAALTRDLMGLWISHHLRGGGC